MFYKYVLVASAMAVLSTSANAQIGIDPTVLRDYIEKRDPDLLGGLAGGLIPGMGGSSSAPGSAASTPTAAAASSTPSSAAATPTTAPASNFKRVAVPADKYERDAGSDPLQQLNDATSDSVVKRNPDLLGGLVGGIVPGLGGQSSTPAGSASSTPTPGPSGTQMPANPILKREGPAPTARDGPNYHLPNSSPLDLGPRDPQLGGGQSGGGGGGAGGLLGPLGGLLGQQQGGSSSSAAPSATPEPEYDPDMMPSSMQPPSTFQKRVYATAT